MVYDKTIGADDFTYAVTLSSTRTTVLDLLSPADRTELLNILYQDGDMTKNRKSTVVDGWVFSESAVIYTSHKATGAEEPIAINTKYPLPVYQFFKKRLFRGSGTMIIRILTSANYDNRNEY